MFECVELINDNPIHNTTVNDEGNSNLSGASEQMFIKNNKIII